MVINGVITSRPYKCVTAVITLLIGVYNSTLYASRGPTIEGGLFFLPKIIGLQVIFVGSKNRWP